MPEVVGSRSFFRDTNAIAPVIPIGKTATGSTDIRNTYTIHIVYEVFADLPNIFNFRVTSHPDAVVNHPTEGFDKMTNNIEDLQLVRTPLCQ